MLKQLFWITCFILICFAHSQSHADEDHEILDEAESAQFGYMYGRGFRGFRRGFRGYGGFRPGFGYGGFRRGFGYGGFRPGFGYGGFRKGFRYRGHGGYYG